MRWRLRRHRAYKCMRKSCQLVLAPTCQTYRLGAHLNTTCKQGWHPKPFISYPLLTLRGTIWQSFLALTAFLDTTVITFRLLVKKMSNSKAIPEKMYLILAPF